MVNLVNINHVAVLFTWKSNQGSLIFHDDIGLQRNETFSNDNTIILWGHSAVNSFSGNSRKALAGLPSIEDHFTHSLKVSLNIFLSAVTLPLPIQNNVKLI